MDEIRHDPEELRNHIEELQEIEEEERRRRVNEALGKFGFVMHTTGWLAGCSYLVLLGALVPKALPYVFIPIGIWTIVLACHGWRAWHPKKIREKRVGKVLEQLSKDARKPGGPGGAPREEGRSDPGGQRGPGAST